MLVTYLKSVPPSHSSFPVIGQCFTLGPFIPSVTRPAVREGKTMSLLGFDSSKPITGSELTLPMFGLALDIKARFWPML